MSFGRPDRGAIHKTRSFSVFRPRSNSFDLFPYLLPHLEKFLMTVVLRKVAAGWRIAAWSWTS